MNKSAVIKITDALPEEAITKPLDVGRRSIRLARERGVFPASWFRTLRSVCEEAGIECPESAFNWKTPLDAAAKDGVAKSHDAPAATDQAPVSALQSERDETDCCRPKSEQGAS